MKDDDARPGSVPRPKQPPRARIQTQIPRRKPAKPASPLETEWDAQVQKRPDRLRMPADKMKR